MSYNLISKTIPAVTGGLFDFEGEGVAGAALLTSPAFILASYVIAEGIGSMTDPVDNSDWPLYVSYTPDNDDVKTDLGVMYDTSPLKDGRISEGEVINHFGIQLKIRTDNHVQGYVKAEEIANALDEVLNDSIIINSNEYLIHNVSRQGAPISLGVEKGTKNRRLFTVNFLVTMKRVI